MRFITLIAVLLSLSQISSSALAWGPFTNRYICNEAVKFVWGVDAVAQCLSQGQAGGSVGFCDSVYDVMGQEYESKCRDALRAGVAIDPSTVSQEIFNDTRNHFDFSKCPINKGTNKQWICGDGARPAYDMYLSWLEETKIAPDLCGRIRNFCVAAAYYADSESSLHNVKYVSNDCVKNIEDSIDRCMQNGVGDCSASQICKFSTRTASEVTYSSITEKSGPINDMGLLNFQQTLGESSSTVNRVIANLTLTGLELKGLPYKPKKGVVLLANSIDLGQASEFIQYLSSNGVNVIVSNASDFEGLKYNSRIIVLGGQNSPQGVGAVSAQILSENDESSLMNAQAGFMFVKDGSWSSGQKIVVIAGNELEDTRRVLSQERQQALDEVKVV
jgi:hypothetical protein